jgi:hypothetical protein
MTVIIVGLTVLTALVDVGAITGRRHALDGYSSTDVPLVVVAQRVQTDLTSADSSAANAFLIGGLEPPNLVASYNQGVAAAGSDLATASSEAGASGAAVADLRTITSNLPTYTGLIATARADNRLGYPVGSAYLRAASSELHDAVLPAAAALARLSATRANAQERRATSVSSVLLVGVFGLLLIGLLIATQILVTRRSRRVVNLGLVAATLLALIVTVVVLGGLGAERGATVSADEHAYAAEARLSQADLLAYQMQADVSQALIAEGNGQDFEADFAVAGTDVNGLIGGVAGTAATETGRQGAGQAAESLGTFLKQESQIQSEDEGGNHAGAVSLALATTPGAPTQVFAALSGDLASGLTAEQAAFASKTSDARSDLDLLPLVVIAGSLLLAAAALGGVQPRINEYR